MSMGQADSQLSTAKSDALGGMGRQRERQLAYFRLNVAVTDLLTSMVRVQVLAVPLHCPVHPAKVALPFAVAVSTTVVGELPANVAVQVLPQLIPAGWLVTVPRVEAVPARVTERRGPAGVGAVTVKARAPDTTVPLATVTCAVPTALTSEGRTAAVNRVALTRVVARSTPFQRTREVVPNPVPSNVSVNPGLPAGVLLGERLVNPGAGVGGGLAVLPSCTTLATEGTPLASTTNNM